MPKYIRTILIIVCSLLLAWSIWAFVPYLHWLMVGGDKRAAVRNIIAGYELPMTIGILLVMAALVMALVSLIKRGALDEAAKPIDEAAELLDESAEPEQQDSLPWFAADIAPEQRKSVEDELRRLSQACQPGVKGVVQPLADKLLQLQAQGVFVLPNNVRAIYKVLYDRYAFRSSFQSLSNAMPAHRKAGSNDSAS